MSSKVLPSPSPLPEYTPDGRRRTMAERFARYPGPVNDAVPSLVASPRDRAPPAPPSKPISSNSHNNRLQKNQENNYHVQQQQQRQQQQKNPPLPEKEENNNNKSKSFRKMFGLKSNNTDTISNNNNNNNPTSQPQPPPGSKQFPESSSLSSFPKTANTYDQPIPRQNSQRPSRPRRPESFHMLDDNPDISTLDKVNMKSAALANHRYGPIQHQPKQPNYSAYAPPPPPQPPQQQHQQKQYHHPPRPAPAPAPSVPMKANMVHATHNPYASFVQNNQPDPPVNRDEGAKSPDFFQKVSMSNDGHSDFSHEDHRFVHPSALPTDLHEYVLNKSRPMQQQPSRNVHVTNAITNADGHLNSGPLQSSPIQQKPLPSSSPSTPQKSTPQQPSSTSSPLAKPQSKSLPQSPAASFQPQQQQQQRQQPAPLPKDNKPSTAPKTTSNNNNTPPRPTLQTNTSYSNSASTSSSSPGSNALSPPSPPDQQTLRRSPSSGYSPLAAFLGKGAASPSSSPNSSKPSSPGFNDDYFKQKEEEARQRALVEEEERNLRLAEEERKRKEEQERLKILKAKQEQERKEQAERERKLREEKEKREELERAERMKRAEEARKAKELERQQEVNAKIEREKRLAEGERQSKLNQIKQLQEQQQPQHNQSQSQSQDEQAPIVPAAVPAKPKTVERTYKTAISSNSSASSHASLSKDYSSTRGSVRTTSTAQDADSIYSKSENLEAEDDDENENENVKDQTNGTEPEKENLVREAQQVIEVGVDDQEEEEEEDPSIGKPRFEFALTNFPKTILPALLEHLDYATFRSLKQVSSCLRTSLQTREATDVALSRYLRDFGYDSKEAASKAQAHATNSATAQQQKRTVKANGTTTIVRTATNGSNSAGSSERPEPLNLRDLEGFMTSLEFSLSEYADLARQNRRQPLDPITLRMQRICTRSWNKVLLHIRAQGNNISPTSKNRIQLYRPICKPGRAVVLRVWVPTVSNWMTDEEVVEAERELWRAGVWTSLKKGDIVHNVACGDFANEGRLIFDGKYLRDLSYNYDSVGHLPSWLNAMIFSPGYFHNVVAASSPDPVMYLDMAPFGTQIAQTLSLCQEQAHIEHAQGRYRVTTYKYRAIVKVTAGMVIGTKGRFGGNELVHPEWEGQLVLQTDGTAEQAKDLLVKSGLNPETKKADLYQKWKNDSTIHPWRVLRSRSRPGKIWLRTLSDEERVT